MKVLKVHAAGKVSPHSAFKVPFRRDEFCKKLEKKSGIKIIYLDPTSRKDLLLIPGWFFLKSKGIGCKDFVIKP